MKVYASIYFFRFFAIQCHVLMRKMEFFPHIPITGSQQEYAMNIKNIKILYYICNTYKIRKNNHTMLVTMILYLIDPWFDLINGYAQNLILKLYHIYFKQRNEQHVMLAIYLNNLQINSNVRNWYLKNNYLFYLLFLTFFSFNASLI